MKIFFNEIIRNEPWGGGVYFLANFVKFLEERNHNVVFKLKRNIDLIFILSNSRIGYKKKTKPIFKYKKKYPNVKILHRINECDKRKNTTHIDQLVFKNNEIADETVFISNWLAEYFIEKGFNKNYNVIYNGCNKNYFYPEEERELGEVTNIVTHHWSKNWMKGFDIYIKLDEILSERKDINFSYIGRYYDGYQPQNTNIISPQYGKNLGNELRKYEIYLTASRWEPCGMHHIEGASCGLPVLYHAEGGGINESCKYYGIEYNDIPSLLEGISKIKESYQEYRNKIPHEFLSKERCSKEFYKVIQNMFM